MLLIGRCLLAVAVLDLALGGNGYLFTIAGLRLREILFVLCMTWTAIWLVRGRLDPMIWLLTGLFVTITVASAGIGCLNGNADILAELKPLAYFPMLLFFVAAIRTEGDVRLVTRLLIACGMTLGVIYLMTLAAVYSGTVRYADVFNFVRGDEFMFRHVLDNQAPYIGFFYKGMVYAGVAAILLMFSTRLWQFSLVIMPAIALTLTRSLYLGMVAAMATGALIDRVKMARAVTAVLILGAVGFTGMMAESRIVEKAPQETAALSTIETTIPRNEGISQRTNDVDYVFKKTSPLELLIGHGLGATIQGRQRIEAGYFEIIYKQGLLGLLPWSAMMFYLVTLYRRNPTDCALAMLCCAIFVYVTHVTLPIMTGSIGMGIVFISLAGLAALYRKTAPAPVQLWRPSERESPSLS